jgi:6-pyruvoyl-tetrahydropterin synthase
MIILTAKAFESLKKKLLSVQKNDHKLLESIREELVEKSPDANAEKLCVLFNQTVKKRLDDYEALFLIDLEHVKKLIQLRKVSIYMQSIVVDCQQLSEKKAYLHQIDFSLLNHARTIVEQEENAKKRLFYTDYFNYDILGHLISVEPRFEDELIESERPTNLLKSLEKNNAKLLVH